MGGLGISNCLLFARSVGEVVEFIGSTDFSGTHVLYTNDHISAKVLDPETGELSAPDFVIEIYSTGNL